MLSLLFAAASLFHPLTPAAPVASPATGCRPRRPAPSACPPRAWRRSTASSSAASGPAAIPAPQSSSGRKGAAVWEKGFGRLGWTSDAGSVVAERTIYDLASLTKVVGTTTAVMILFDEGKIHLDDPVVKYIPEFAGGAKDHVTIRMLLEHRSGLPAGRDLWRIAHTPEEARAAVISTPLFARPASTTSTPTSAPTCSASSSRRSRDSGSTSSSTSASSRRSA